MRDVANIMFGAVLSTLLGISIPFIQRQFGVQILTALLITVVCVAAASSIYAYAVHAVDSYMIYWRIRGYWKITLTTGKKSTQDMTDNPRINAMAYIGYKGGSLIYKGWGIDSETGRVGSDWRSATNTFVPAEDSLFFNATANINADLGMTDARNHGEIHFIGSGGRRKLANGRFIDLYGDGTVKHYNMSLVRVRKAEWEQALLKANAPEFAPLIKK